MQELNVTQLRHNHLESESQELSTTDLRNILISYLQRRDTKKSTDYIALISGYRLLHVHAMLYRIDTHWHPSFCTVNCALWLTVRLFTFMFGLERVALFATVELEMEMELLALLVPEIT